MSFGDEREPELEAVPVPVLAPFPRMLAQSREAFAAQDAAARAAGLDWHSWAARALEAAARAATPPAEPKPGRLVGAERGAALRELAGSGG